MQVDFHRTRIRLQTPRNKQKGFQRNSQRNKAEKRMEEIMRTSRSMGGKRQSTWDTGGPIPAVRWECHTIRVWPHQITFLYMRFSK